MTLMFGTWDGRFYLELCVCIEVTHGFNPMRLIDSESDVSFT